MGVGPPTPSVFVARVRVCNTPEGRGEHHSEGATMGQVCFTAISSHRSCHPRSSLLSVHCSQILFCESVCPSVQRLGSGARSLPPFPPYQVSCRLSGCVGAILRFWFWFWFTRAISWQGSDGLGGSEQSPVTANRSVAGSGTARTALFWQVLALVLVLGVSPRCGAILRGGCPTSVLTVPKAPSLKGIGLGPSHQTKDQVYRS